MSFENPIDAEKELATLLQEGSEAEVLLWLDQNAREVAFTGRCYSLAITQGMTEAALRMGKAGYHLAVTDDAAAQRAIDEAQSMRGLLSFLGDYRYCKAQRSYYLAVAEGECSCAPIGALLGADLLSEHDKSELLSLCLRMDNPQLARVLITGNAQLIDDIRQDIPSDLIAANNISMENTGKHWAEMVTPQRSLETLELIFEQMGDASCKIHKSWWGSYQRQEGFAQKLGVIAQHSKATECDCAAELLQALAQSGELDGLRAVIAWENLEAGWLDSALEAAQSAGHAEAAAIIMRAHRKTDDALDLLDF